MAEIRGTYDDLFSAVPSALATFLDAGDVGGSAAVFVDGEPVVDVWGGFADADRTVPWERETIVNVFSVTKPMTALCALLLADRGELDLDAPVARYWPQFAAAGKEKVLVRHLLSHTAGLPDWDPPPAPADLADWACATARLAAQAPQWEPGTAAGYHSLTFGFLVGEVVRRITGRTVGEFLAAEVTGPLGADFHIGLAAGHDHRVAPMVPPPGRDEEYAASAPGATAPGAARAGATTAGAAETPEMAPATTPTKAPARVPLRVRDANGLAWRRAEIPAANGFGNARSVALVQSVVACGGTVGGVRLLSPEGCSRAWEEQFNGEDRLLHTKSRYGLGYGLFGTTYGWGGWGGSLVMLEPDTRLVVAYATNQMREPTDDNRGLELLMAAYDGVRALRT
jgi:CubicO group peptidase (beta-lactamase class C family)